MSEQVELEVGFDDEFSGPSQRAGKAGERLLATMHRLERVSGSGGTFATGPVSRFTGAIQKSSAAMGQLSDMVGSAGTRLLSMMGSAVTGVVIGGLTALAAAAAAASAALVHGVVSAGMLRERAGLALSVLARNGSFDLERLRKLALSTGTTMETAFDGMRAMLAAGFATDDAERWFKRMQDLSMIGITDETRKRIVLAMSQIKGAGKLQGDELRQLQETGLNVGMIWEEIAKSMGVSVEEAMALKEQGKVGADVALRGIEKAVAALTGSEMAGGARMKFLDETLGGAAERVRSLWAVAMNDIAKSAAPAFKEFSAVAKDLQEALEGKRFREFSDLVAKAFVALAPGIRAAVGVLGEFADGMMTVMGVTMPGTLSSTEKLIAALGSPEFKAFAKAMGMLFAVWVHFMLDAVNAWLAVTLVINAVTGAVSDLVEWFKSLGGAGKGASSSITGAFAGLPGQALSWGSGIASGLIDGVLNGIAARFGEVQSSIRAMMTPSMPTLMPSLAGFAAPGVAPAASPLGSMPGIAAPTMPSFKGFEIPSFSGLMGAALAPPTVASQQSGGKTVQINQTFSAIVGKTAAELWPELAGNVRRETQSVVRSMGGL